jgi:hypothetical protein
MRFSAHNVLLTAIILVTPGFTVFAEDAILLFDGQSLNGWTTMDGKPVTEGWEVVDGMLHLSKSEKRAGNILTDKEYENFDLQFEWKIEPGGNNGLKYRVRKYGNRVLGCEYQILDDSAYVERLRPKGLTGSLYDVYEPSNMHAAKPVGEFNHSRIIVQGQHIQHWLNGELIVSAFAGSRQWRERIAASKFADVEGFGENHVGKIMLTDHNSEVWYRKMLLKPLPPPQLAVAAPRPKRVHVCAFRFRILRRLSVCCRRRR